jgi:hypothetical protein
MCQRSREHWKLILTAGVDAVISHPRFEGHYADDIVVVDLDRVEDVQRFPGFSKTA